jgi:hypothetical protein
VIGLGEFGDIVACIFEGDKEDDLHHGTSDRPGGIEMGKQILIRCSVKVDLAASLRAIAVVVYLT